MAEASYNFTPHHIISVGEAIDNAINYIDGRRTGEIRSLKTKWKKFNSISMGGIEPNALYTVAGISGSGKSAFANQLETDIIDLNPDEDIVVLSLTFEMMASKQITRKLSGIVKRNMKFLYSIDRKITDEEMEIIRNASHRLRKYPIYYVDVALDTQAIEDTIQHFQNQFPDKWLVVFLDHTLLVEGKSSESEQMIITDLQKRFIKLKKIGRTSIIQVSQLNREIEKSERINNRSQQYPMRSDVSTSDKIYQASDYVFAIHRPETLGIEEYGPEAIDPKGLVFLHVIKNREGQVGIIVFENNLQFNCLEESNKY